MALHTELPIYKVSYDLLSHVATMSRNMPRDFGKVADLRWKFPNHVAVPVAKRGVVLMLPRVAANQGNPKAA